MESFIKIFLSLDWLAPTQFVVSTDRLWLDVKLPAMFL